MPERIHGGQVVVVVGAVALIVSLFLNWFQPGNSAWTVFETMDLVLAAIGVAAVAAVVPAPDRRPERGPLVAARWLPLLGVAALVIVAAALINHPPAARGDSPEVGAWIGLGAAILLTAGGILSTARISVVITLRSRAPKPQETAEPDPDADTATHPLPEQ
jgi:peptidoglycan/LPS O-acetylase OafA/YrhL